MASRTEKQKTTFYDHFAKKYRCDGKRKRIWLRFLKTSANKKYRKENKKNIKKELDELE
jgi:hypothetical protein